MQIYVLSARGHPLERTPQHTRSARCAARVMVETKPELSRDSANMSHDMCDAPNWGLNRKAAENRCSPQVHCLQSRAVCLSACQSSCAPHASRLCIACAERVPTRSMLSPFRARAPMHQRAPHTSALDRATPARKLEHASVLPRTHER